MSPITQLDFANGAADPQAVLKPARRHCSTGNLRRQRQSIRRTPLVLVYEQRVAAGAVITNAAAH
jgi:hypothetical protein